MFGQFLNIFDVANYDNFLEGLSEKNCEKRLNQLDKIKSRIENRYNYTYSDPDLAAQQRAREALDKEHDKVVNVIEKICEFRKQNKCLL